MISYDRKMYLIKIKVEISFKAFKFWLNVYSAINQHWYFVSMCLFISNVTVQGQLKFVGHYYI